MLSDAARLLLGPLIARYSAEHPDVGLEVVVQDAMVDIVGEGFDAVIRFGDRMPDDMIAMPLGDPLLWVMVASPAYLEAAGEPESLEDLARHRCIGMRTGNWCDVPLGTRRGESSPHAQPLLVRSRR